MSENWWLIIVLLLVAVVALWWIIGGRADAKPRVDQQAPTAHLDEPAPHMPAPPAPEVSVATVEPSPVIVGPAATPVDVPPPVAAGPPDELTRMKGVGPKVAALLNENGVTRFDQIAALSDAEAAALDAKLGAFKGRIGRDQWIEQARLLAAGDTAGYEAKFGKLG